MIVERPMSESSRGHAIRRTPWLVACAILLAWCGAAQAQQDVQGTIPISWITGQKPQSKLWYDQGTWWAALPREDGVHFWKLSGGRFEQQASPEVLGGTRFDCECDVVLAKDTLFVLGFQRTSDRSMLHALKYADGAYKELPGYPLTFQHAPNLKTMTMDVDSTGLLWIGYVSRDAQVQVQTLDPNKPEAGFSKPFTVAAGSPGSICGVAAFKGHIGVFWNDGVKIQFLFRAHADGQPIDQWGDAEVAGAGRADINDHINMACAPDGSLYVVNKALMSPKIEFCRIVLRHRTLEGKWDKAIEVLPKVKGIVGTRPIVVLDNDRPVAYVLYTDRTGWPAQNYGIYLHRVNLADDTVAEAEKILTADYDLNNATGLKGRVSAKTGLMVVAGPWGEVDPVVMASEVAARATMPASALATMPARFTAPATCPADLKLTGPAKYRLVPLGEDK